MVAGDVAPDFTLATDLGEPIHLYETLERSNAVLFFYVKAFTPVCMNEVCSFRDSADDFASLNAVLFGISPDTETVTRKFSEFHKLPFRLLIDKGNQVNQLYRVPKLFGLLPGRSTFVVGQDRLIKRVVHAGFQSTIHVKESLHALRRV